MAADRQSTKGNMKYKSFPKIMKIDNILLGLAGNVDGIMAVREWFKNGRQGDFPKVDTINGLIVAPEGIFEFYDNGNLIPVVLPFFAIGSGSEVAMGAMEAGADIKTALSIARKYDAGTGIGMTYLELS